MECPICGRTLMLNIFKISSERVGKVENVVMGAEVQPLIDHLETHRTVRPITEPAV